MPMNPAQSALAAYERLVFQFGIAVAADAVIVSAFRNAAAVVNAKAASLRAQIADAAERRQPNANTVADADESDNIDSESAPS